MLVVCHDSWSYERRTRKAALVVKIQGLEELTDKVSQTELRGAQSDLNDMTKRDNTMQSRFSSLEKKLNKSRNVIETEKGKQHNDAGREKIVKAIDKLTTQMSEKKRKYEELNEKKNERKAKMTIESETDGDDLTSKSVQDDDSAKEPSECMTPPVDTVAPLSVTPIDTASPSEEQKTDKQADTDACETPAATVPKSKRTNRK